MAKPDCETCGKSANNQCRAITGKNDLAERRGTCVEQPLALQGFGRAVLRQLSRPR